jgi:two-component system NarL family sensor kinase
MHNVSHVDIRLVETGEIITLTIEDDGTGFDIQDIENHPKRGIGLSNMHERMATVNGSLDILSGAGGTSVIAKIRMEKYDDR